MAADVATLEKSNEGFIRGFGLLDSTMIVAGSIIGSGIFIVPAGVFLPDTEFLIVIILK